MYHEHFLNQSRQSDKRPSDLHTGYYSFHFNGGIVTGNLKRIGADTVSIDSPMMGKIEMKMSDFLKSDFKKL